jgi:hypothetical protein
MAFNNLLYNHNFIAASPYIFCLLLSGQATDDMIRKHVLNLLQLFYAQFFFCSLYEPFAWLSGGRITRKLHRYVLEPLAAYCGLSRLSGVAFVLRVSRAFETVWNIHRS